MSVNKILGNGICTIGGIGLVYSIIKIVNNVKRYRYKKKRINLEYEYKTLLNAFAIYKTQKPNISKEDQEKIEKLAFERINSNIKNIKELDKKYYGI